MLPPLEACLPRASMREQALARTVLALAQAGAHVAALVARAGLVGDLASVTAGGHAAADPQRMLDSVADRAFVDALAAAPIAWLASEERGEATLVHPGAPLAIAIDPLDGSSNIAANAPIGAIFSVLDAAEDVDATFLPARKQRAAGFFLFGPATALVLSVGAGVDLFVLDPDTRRFHLARTGLVIADDACEVAINASNRRRWEPSLRTWWDDCLAGEDGPLGADHNMRWIASLVAEAFRILERGGLFLYPADGRPGYEQGRIRLVYEARPIAFLIEQAGGAATDGHASISTLSAASLHARTPLIFGSRTRLHTLLAYLSTDQRKR